MAKPSINVCLIGHKFMGRTHSNAFVQAPRFFDVPFQPVLKAVCARNPDRVKTFVLDVISTRSPPIAQVSVFPSA